MSQFELFLSTAVGLAVAAPVVRVASKRPVRRELRAHPVLALLAIAVASAGLLLAIWLASVSPTARRVMLGVLAVGGLTAWIHARPSYGRKRGLPPGSLGLSESLDAIDDPSFYARAATRHGPVFKMQQVHQPVACVTDLRIAAEVLGRDDSSLGQSEWSFNRLVPGGYLEYMEGDAHQRYRDLFSAAFGPEVVEAARATIASTARQQLDAMARAGGSAGVHPEPFLYEVPFISLLHAVLGVSREHAQLPALRAGFAAITVPFELHLPTPPSIATGYRDLVAIVRKLADDAASCDTPSVLRAVCSSADDPTVLGNLVLMVKEGSIMVRGLLRWVLKALAADSSRVSDFRNAAGDAQKLDALSIAFVRETLRLNESRYLYRTARESVTIGNYRVPRGWLVRLCTGEAHEDSRHFPDPQQFRPSRFLGQLPDESAYCPFGTGKHSCLGDELTLAIAAGFAREAALCWDLRTTRDGQPWRINRHWGLWRPSQEFRLVLTPRAP